MKFYCQVVWCVVKWAQRDKTGRKCLVSCDDKPGYKEHSKGHPTRSRQNGLELDPRRFTNRHLGYSTPYNFLCELPANVTMQVVATKKAPQAECTDAN
uniref:Uncharacterized protein n=1 Tax=Timema cristinae TaxID=61476 RepID=A0A7R9D4Z9_TIMCR|nr:unnamed protein product [Timema cristinae]